MKRDMELIRKILFKIEEEVDNLTVYDLEVNGYSMDQVAYHCSLLYDGGLIKDYEAQEADDELDGFIIDGLTWYGHEFLDDIRSDTVWDKTKETIKTNGLPMVFDVVKEIAKAFISATTQAAIKGIIN